MKKLLLLSILAVCLNSCLVNNYSKQKLIKKYEFKMDNDMTVKIKDPETGNINLKTNKEIFNSVTIYFSDNSIEKPYEILTLSKWNYVNYRPFVFLPFPMFLVLFSKMHIYNQSLRRAAITCSKFGGDAVIIGCQPEEFKVIKFKTNKIIFNQN